jgi:hypothetical protein
LLLASLSSVRQSSRIQVAPIQMDAMVEANLVIAIDHFVHNE